MPEYIANGFPKTGTHALVKALELLGAGVVTHAHQPAPYEFPGSAKHICIFRHPRNCLLSMCRFRGFPTTTGMLIGLVKNYGDVGPMAEALSLYLPWKKDSRTLCVNYEDLVASDAGLRAIADYAGLPFLDDAFANLPGLTMTWTGSPSRWRDHWSAELDEIWRSSGMRLLETALGYSDAFERGAGI